MNGNKMVLSEAIRIGALMHPQGFGKYVQRDEDNSIQYTCAIGAAFVGAGSLAEFTGSLLSDSRHPVTNKLTTVYQIIADLNDDERWTRNQIADWIEREVENDKVLIKDSKELVDEQATHNENHLAVR